MLLLAVPQSQYTKASIAHKKELHFGALFYFAHVVTQSAYVYHV